MCVLTFSKRNAEKIYLGQEQSSFIRNLKRNPNFVGYHFRGFRGDSINKFQQTHEMVIFCMNYERKRKYHGHEF